MWSIASCLALCVLAGLASGLDGENGMKYGAAPRPYTAARGTLSTAASIVTHFGSPAIDCACGYVLSAHSDAYFPLLKEITFASMPDIPGSEFDALGLEVGRWSIGCNYEGTRSVGSVDNVYVKNAVLELRVPGGQSVGGSISAAEVLLKDTITGGVFTMEAKLGGNKGTCQSILTFHTNDGSGNSDEQDIEIIGSKGADDGMPPVIELTNWNPAGKDNSHQSNPFPANPIDSFHNYTIAWLPNATTYQFDGQQLKAPAMYRSVNPSRLIMNNWSNGSPGFTLGPPAADNLMQGDQLTQLSQIGPILLPKPSGTRTPSGVLDPVSL
ncbi:concanavalin A-like lectin/glucanase domain-containing protein [Dioszegia hungarica]|uniref:Concanavalin A-like lectin/glucanase domain-containing protein n=1 Tax=Dioszegia hungarica TaxID=4972 RepID=A0AA38HC50_9TREE|nr:concanavalin A-like lectin/glucanase domain-containing protein [Dioszegia hungarica]KAI9636234.1 concanavalin A-like lectin/glucanase domain-containing protein [Dioszegia hungarica]